MNQTARNLKCQWFELACQHPFLIAMFIPIWFGTFILTSQALAVTFLQ